MNSPTSRMGRQKIRLYFTPQWFVDKAAKVLSKIKVEHDRAKRTRRH